MIKIGKLEIPEKIVIIDQDDGPKGWGSFYGRVLQLKHKEGTEVIHFQYEWDNEIKTSWFYTFEFLNGEIKYVSYEKFLKLKAFT